MSEHHDKVQEALKALSGARRSIESLGVVVQNVNRHEERRQADAQEAHLRIKALEAELADAKALLRELREIPFVFNYIDDDNWLARRDALLSPTNDEVQP